MSTKVIFHVAGTLNGIGLHMPFELFEDLVVALPHYVGQHIQTTTVRHTNNSACEMLCGSCRQNSVDNRNSSFTAVKTKALCAYILCCQELFKCLCSIEALHDAVFLRQRWIESDTL